ncbi:hypothetical protein SAMN04487787_12813 [Kosakonia sacchari]|nr:hypothetical protein SAMN04487787_12813 [Kosakonia sacchari]
MADLNTTQLKLFHNLFPELTPVQTDTAVLYSYGLGREEVAGFRRVSVPAVDKSLTTCRRLLHVESLGQLRTVVLLRINVSLFLSKNTE